MKRQSLTGNVYHLDDLGKIIRIDYNPNQPRDARGRWSSGGSGGGVAVDLTKKKVSELHAIAKDQGIDINKLSYKNRKSVLAAAIEASKKGKSLRELGLLKPQKTTLIKRRSSKLELQEKKPQFQYKYNYHPKVKTVLDKGQDFTNKYKLDERPPLSKKELEIQAKIDKIMERRKQAKGNTIKDLERLQVLQEQLEKEKDKADFEVIRKHRQLLEDLKSNNRMSAADDRALIKDIEFSPKFDSREKQITIKLLNEFNQLTNGMGAKTVKKVVGDSDRAFTGPDGLVDIGKKATRENIYHELAHHIEFSDPKKAELAARWRDAKSNDITPKKLSEITGSNLYDDDELALRDDYISPYVGKVYPSGYTEVISVGVEHFSSPNRMKELYDKDPDHYNFIVGLLMK